LFLASVVLSGSESTAAGLNDGLVGYYSFNDCSAKDSSEAGNDGTFVGANECVQGVNGNALKLGGYYQPGHVTVPSSPSLAFLDNYTFTIWFNVQSYTSMYWWGEASELGAQTLFAKAGDREGLDIRTLRSDANSLMHVRAMNGRCCGYGQEMYVIGEPVVGLNEWHMMTFTSGGGQVGLYLDCKLEASLPTGEFNVNTSMQYRPLQIGIDQSAWWYPINGILDEARVYNRALSADEVRALYKAAGMKCAGENEPPAANAGTDQTLEMTSCAGAQANLDGSGSCDPDNDALAFSWTENGQALATGANPSVSLPYGSHTITLTVDDGKGATATDTVVVSVVDTKAPCLDVAMNPNVLWPPNHKYVTVSPNISVTDACVESVTVQRVSAASSEPDNGLGDGDTAGDVVLNAGGALSLRAERSGAGSGRVYTITYEARDIAGNSTTASASVIVPHNK
jgi:hypothetical protein